jgi:hypothetical protein
MRSLPFDLQRIQCAHYVLADGISALLGAIVEKNGELVTTQARHGVGCAHTAAADLRDLA